MIASLIRWSVVNRVLVLIATAFLIVAGVFAVLRTPLDALPDLSDTQVIIRTPYPGKAPQVVLEATSAAALEVVRLADLKRYAVKLDQEK